MILATIIAASTMFSGSFSNSYFEDFNDGVANGWTEVHGDWDVPTTYYRGIGRPQTGYVFNVSHVPATFGTGMSVEALMSTDTGSDDVNKMIVLRYNDPDNFYTVSFRAGWRRDVVVERMQGGNRIYITPEFQFLIPQHGQAEWKRVRADIIGNRVIAYFEGLPVCDIAIPGTLIPSGTAGTNAFSSSGGDEEIYVDYFSWAVAQFAPGTSINVDIGSTAFGGLPHVAAADNVYFPVSPKSSSTRFGPIAQVTWIGKVSILPVRELTLRFEGSVDSGSCTQQIEVWNWSTSQFVQFDSRFISTQDKALRFPLGSQYMNSSGEVKVRAKYFPRIPTMRLNVRIDEINVHAVAL